MKIIVLLVLIFCISLTSNAQEQKIEKCSAPKDTGGKYKLIAETVPLGKPRTVVLDVLIKPKNFTKEYLTKFSQRIKAEYCKEEIIYAALFDTKKAQLGWHYDLVVDKIDRRRGNYVFNKIKGIEGLDFSSKRGNPINEVKLELSENSNQ